MFNFFNLLSDHKSDYTISLYCLIYIFSSILAILSQYRSSKDKPQFRQALFWCSFLILWIFYALNDIGEDTPNYRGYFKIYKSMNEVDEGYGSVELWYQYLNIFLHFITDNPIIGVLLIRTIQLLIVYYSIYLLRDKVSVGFSIMAYIALFYFQSFDLLRSSLAGSFCILSFSLLSKKKNFAAFFFGFLAFEIHHSAALFMIAILLYFISTVFGKYYYIVQIIGLLGVIIVINIGQDILNLVFANDFGGGRYDIYTAYSGSSFGLFILIQYTPVILSLLFLKKIFRSKQDNNWWNLCFIFALCGFSIGILGYTNGMLTRTAIYFSSSFLFLIPSFINKIDKLLTPDSAIMVKLSLIMFYTYQFMSYTGNNYSLDGIGPYKFI